MTSCRQCGAQLAPDARFCPRCGTPVEAVAAPTSTVPPAAPVPEPARSVSGAPVPARVERRGGAWWIIPLVIVALVLIAWLLLAGLPFGRDREARVEAPAVETIAESTAPPPASEPTGTIVETQAEPNIATQTTTITTPPPLPTTTTQEPPRVIEEPAAPLPSSPAPVPPRETAREMTEDEATAVLRGYITSRSYYPGVSTQCIQLRPSGYRNAGYGYSVWDSCATEGGSRMLGRWRVDSKTREVFVQRDDGRYLRP